MTWKIKDEWFDAPLSRHVVRFHNPDFLVADASGKLAPQEHHLIHEFKLPCCPHCGTPNADPLGKPVDFEKKKTEVLAKLNAHHLLVMQNREKSPHVPLASGPKK